MLDVCIIFFVEFLINLLGDIKYLNSLCIINDNYFVLEIIFFLIIVFIYNYFVVFFNFYRIIYEGGFI